MLRILRKSFLAALPFIGLFLMSGCSSVPTAPQLGAGTAGPPPSALTTSTDDGSNSPSGMATTGVTTTREINGLLGGLVRAGRFTVIVPPGAFSGFAAVTVSQPDLSTLVCDLSISPASKNGFLVPVLLLADCRGLLPGTLLSTSFISWYDPANGTWTRVPGSTVNLLNLSVQAPLWHFSRYRVEDGKAGW
jgi:hypothetical protein